MPDDYEEERQELFAGKKVRVTSNESQYEGWVVDISSNKIILDGATKSNENVGVLEVCGYSAIELLTRDWAVTEVPVNELQESKYSTREYGTRGLAEFVRDVRESGTIGSFPTVRKVSDGYELISGHRRTEAAKRAGFTTIPVRVVEYDDWRYVTAFVDEHLAMPSNISYSSNSVGEVKIETPRWKYSMDEAQEAVSKLQEDWPRERLRMLPPVEFILDFEDESE